MINLIVAVNEVFAIGSKGELLYFIPNDLQRFKNKTMGNYCVMGRNTFDSLPRPFDGRTNVVLTSNSSFKEDIKYKYPNYDIMVESNLEKILNQYKNTGEQDKELFICGGVGVYAESMPYVDNIYLTMVHDDREGDSYFPKQELNNFKQVKTEKHYSEEHDLFYSFIDYVRK